MATIGDAAKIDDRIFTKFDRPENTDNDTDIIIKQNENIAATAYKKQYIYNKPIPSKRDRDAYASEKPKPVKIWNEREIRDYEKTRTNNGEITMSQIKAFVNENKNDFVTCAVYLLRHISHQRKYGICFDDILDILVENGVYYNKKSVSSMMSTMMHSELRNYFEVYRDGKKIYYKWDKKIDKWPCVNSNVISEVKNMISEYCKETRENRKKKKLKDPNTIHHNDDCFIKNAEKAEPTNDDNEKSTCKDLPMNENVVFSDMIKIFKKMGIKSVTFNID